MTDINVIVISSIRPEPTSAGYILLYRHLVNQPDVTLQIYGFEPTNHSLNTFFRRITGHLRKGFLKKPIDSLWALWEGRWLDPELPEIIENPENTIVFTVAHGDAFQSAQRFACKHNLPLVVSFQDWWPDIANVYRPIKRHLEQQFISLYNSSAVAICVCPEMKHSLGKNERAYVLYPIPEEANSKASASNTYRHCSRPIKVIYFGNLAEYGPMLAELLEASLDVPEIFIQVRGENPRWPTAQKERMRSLSRWLDFAPRGELDTWFDEADAVVIPMVFEETFKRRMETSFPSKLVEFAQFGKPIIIWGPNYCSASRWARERSSALCVHDRNPESVVKAIKTLRQSPDEYERLSVAAREAAANEFSPSEIQGQFKTIMKSVILSSRSS